MKKLILIDYNNICYQILFSKYLLEKYKNFENINENDFQLKHDILKIFFYKIFNLYELNLDYNLDFIFAKDGYKLWRRERIYNLYKQQRKEMRDSSKINFKKVFKIFNIIFDELNDSLPFQFITFDNVETDDIIYITIMSKYDEYDKFQIYSFDQDFIQLLKNDKVEIFNPRTQQFIKVDDPDFYLFSKIIKGDKSDNIPNIFSNSYENFQKRIYNKQILRWFNNKELFKQYLKTSPTEIKENFIRNKKLISLKEIPQDIFEFVSNNLYIIKKDFNNQKLLHLLFKYNLNMLLDKVDFILNK